MGWLEFFVPLAFSTFFLIGFYYQSQQKTNATKLLITVISVVGVILSCLLFGLKGYPYYLFLLSFSIGMVFYPQQKKQIQLLVLHLCCLGFVILATPTITPLMEIPYPFAFGLMTFFFVLTLFFVIIYTYTNENRIFEINTNKLVNSLKKQKEQIEEQSEALKSFNKRLQKEIRAKNIIEEQLKKSNNQLKRFAYVASHDLKEPLRTISSFTYLLNKELDGQIKESKKEYLDFISGGVKRMSTLLEDLLAYSRLENNNDFAKEYIDLNQLIANLKHNLTNLIQRNKGTIIIEKELPKIYGCPTQINQLFQNIISNALKFKGEHPPLIHISWEESADDFTFSIKDNGIGISQKDQTKIFEAFQRLDKNKYEGSGIGLATCKTVAENHNGKIWLTSEIGQGTTFYFSIPKVEIEEVVEV